ncbi:MAG: prenyltransferase [Spirochaetaceae bacterium]
MALVTFSQFLSVIEIRTKIVSVSSFGLGTLFAATVVPLDPLLTTLMALAVLAVDMGTTAFNSFFDFMRRVDTNDFAREREKVLLHEGVPPGAALIIAGGLFAIAVALGLILSFLVGLEVAVIGAVSMLVGFLYTGGPRPLSTTPFGELFAGGFLGSVLFLLSAYIHTGFVSRELFLSSLPSLFLVASILAVNNACDREGDKAAGRKTLAILLGGERGPYLIYLLGALAFGAAFASLPTEPFHYPILGVTLFVSAGIFVSMHRRGYRHETKLSSMGSISQIFLLYTLAAAIILLHRSTTA